MITTAELHLCHKKETVSKAAMNALFEQKCEARQISPDKGKLLSNDLREWNRAAWRNQLTPMLKSPPDDDVVWTEWVAFCETNL